ncbi:MAG: sulfatase [Lentisphaeraceae bacterium]|nr:sulfatase [Lentisphaeraceae bacterium]
MRLLYFFLFLLPVALTAADKPNILFFFTDDQSYDSLGVYGNPDVKTPHIDSLGQRGVVFDRHYNTTAICMASRANVMTGLYEYKTGCNFSHGTLGTKQWSTSFPILLKKAGYKTGFGGKFGFSITESPANERGKHEGERAKQDFDFWVGGPGQTNYATKKNPTLAKYAKKYPHSSRAYGAASIDFIRKSVKEKAPFCMSVFFKAPHRPVSPDPMFKDVYKDTVFRKLPNYGRDSGSHLALHSQKGRQYPRFKEWGYHTDKSYQKAMRLYHQQIHGVDYAIGMILEELKKQNIADNTVIVFSSDNGFFNGSHGLGSKVLPYEEGARVPLIIYDPRNEKSGTMRRTKSLSGNVDITATILDFAGVQTPDNYDGKSLVPILSKTDTDVRETLPIIQAWGPEETRCLTILTKEFKYIYWYFEDEKQKLSSTEELFDLRKDPFEMKNVVNNPEYKSVLDRMKKEYDSQVNSWKNEGVKYNEYEEYEVLFDRNTSWEAKAKVLKEKGLGK